MDEELVYKQNMSRNEAMKILKAITIPLAVFGPGLVYHQSFGAFGRKLVCPLSGFMWIIGVAVAFLMPSQRNDTLNHMLLMLSVYYSTLITFHVVLSIVSGVSSEMIAKKFPTGNPYIYGKYYSRISADGDVVYRCISPIRRNCLCS
ncbi:MAG: hypothetical protein ACLTX3_06980 [Lachnospiraceae bacterium]